MTVSQVKMTYLNNRRYELEPLKALADRDVAVKADVKPPVKLEEYAAKISEVHKLDERV